MSYASNCPGLRGTARHTKRGSKIAEIHNIRKLKAGLPFKKPSAEVRAT